MNTLDQKPHSPLSIQRVTGHIVLGLGMFLFGFGLRSVILKSENSIQLISPLSSLNIEKKRENIYEKYSFPALRNLQLSPTDMHIVDVLEEQPSYTAYLISWQIPDLLSGEKRLVSGQMNVPRGNGPFPIILMMRGYVEKDIYKTGVGTKNAAATFAQNGYITIAPDFLGYGTSDPESNDTLLARFERPITVLQLLANLNDLTVIVEEKLREPGTIDILPEPLERGLFDTQRLGIWAHSNGGQIALSILEITSKNIPATLWAPVSKPFPYSVLYFSDDLSDQGAYLREQISLFEYELKNKAQDFSVLSEPARILAPIQIHQGAKDEAVPLKWSQQLKEKLTEATVSAELFTYPQADHNMVPDWNTAIQRDLQFFAKNVKK